MKKWPPHKALTNAEIQRVRDALEYAADQTGCFQRSIFDRSDLQKHPSGRPIRKAEKRSWGMWGWRRTDFVNPRLNAPPIPRITSATDIHAVGFIDHRVGYLPGWEDSAKGGKR